MRRSGRSSPPSSRRPASRSSSCSPRIDEMFDQANAALEAGQPPDFLYSHRSAHSGLPGGPTTTDWPILKVPFGPVLDLFDADAIEASTLLNGKTGRRGLYALPMGRGSNHVHVWNSLLERAGFTLADIPKEWEAFWSFWCDEVQPAVRRATGRDDIWGVGLAHVGRGFGHRRTSSFSSSSPTTRRGSPRWPSAGRRSRGAGGHGQRRSTDYTAIWRKGCTPPDATSWTNHRQQQGVPRADRS